jgi:hypothetical protein
MINSFSYCLGYCSFYRHEYHAQKAEISFGTVFNYFPDKSSLLIAALLDDRVKVQKDAMVSFPSDVTVCEKFLYLSNLFYQYYAKNPNLSRTSDCAVLSRVLS